MPQITVSGATPAVSDEDEPPEKESSVPHVSDENKSIPRLASSEPVGEEMECEELNLNNNVVVKTISGSKVGETMEFTFRTSEDGKEFGVDPDDLIQKGHLHGYALHASLQSKALDKETCDDTPTLDNEYPYYIHQVIKDHSDPDVGLAQQGKYEGGLVPEKRKPPRIGETAAPSGSTLSIASDHTGIIAVVTDDDEEGHVSGTEQMEEVPEVMLSPSGLKRRRDEKDPDWNDPTEEEHKKSRQELVEVLRRTLKQDDELMEGYLEDSGIQDSENIAEDFNLSADPPSVFSYDESEDLDEIDQTEIEMSEDKVLLAPEKVWRKREKDKEKEKKKQEKTKKRESGKGGQTLAQLARSTIPDKVKEAYVKQQGSTSTDRDTTHSGDNETAAVLTHSQGRDDTSEGITQVQTDHVEESLYDGQGGSRHSVRLKPNVLESLYVKSVSDAGGENHIVAHSGTPTAVGAVEDKKKTKERKKRDSGPVFDKKSSSALSELVRATVPDKVKEDYVKTGYSPVFQGYPPQQLPIDIQENRVEDKEPTATHAVEEEGDPALTTGSMLSGSDVAGETVNKETEYQDSDVEGDPELSTVSKLAASTVPGASLNKENVQQGFDIDGDPELNTVSKLAASTLLGASLNKESIDQDSDVEGDPELRTVSKLASSVVPGASINNENEDSIKTRYAPDFQGYPSQQLPVQTQVGTIKDQDSIDMTDPVYSDPEGDPELRTVSKLAASIVPGASMNKGNVEHELDIEGDPEMNTISKLAASTMPGSSMNKESVDQDSDVEGDPELRTVSKLASSVVPGASMNKENEEEARYSPVFQGYPPQQLPMKAQESSVENQDPVVRVDRAEYELEGDPAMRTVSKLAASVVPGASMNKRTVDEDSDIEGDPQMRTVSKLAASVARMGSVAKASSSDSETSDDGDPEMKTISRLAVSVAPRQTPSRSPEIDAYSDRDEGIDMATITRLAAAFVPRSSLESDSDLQDQDLDADMEGDPEMNTVTKLAASVVPGASLNKPRQQESQEENIKSESSSEQNISTKQPSSKAAAYDKKTSSALSELARATIPGKVKEDYVKTSHGGTEEDVFVESWRLPSLVEFPPTFDNGGSTEAGGLEAEYEIIEDLGLGPSSTSSSESEDRATAAGGVVVHRGLAQRKKESQAQLERKRKQEALSELVKGTAPSTELLRSMESAPPTESSKEGDASPFHRKKARRAERTTKGAVGSLAAQTAETTAKLLRSMSEPERYPDDVSESPRVPVLSILSMQCPAHHSVPLSHRSEVLLVLDEDGIAEIKNISEEPPEDIDLSPSYTDGLVLGPNPYEPLSKAQLENSPVAYPSSLQDPVLDSGLMDPVQSAEPQSITSETPPKHQRNETSELKVKVVPTVSGTEHLPIANTGRPSSSLWLPSDSPDVWHCHHPAAGHRSRDRQSDRHHVHPSSGYPSWKPVPAAVPVDPCFLPFCQQTSSDFSDGSQVAALDVEEMCPHRILCSLLRQPATSEVRPLLLFSHR